MKAIRKGPGAPRRYRSLLHASPGQFAGLAANASTGAGERRRVDRRTDGNHLGLKSELVFKRPQSFVVELGGWVGAMRGSLAWTPKKGE